jgi:hypothetical protein
MIMTATDAYLQCEVPPRSAELSQASARVIPPPALAVHDPYWVVAEPFRYANVVFNTCNLLVEHSEHLLSIDWVAVVTTLSRAVATHAAADALRAQRSADFAARRAVVEAAAVATLAAGFSNATGRDNMPPPLPPVAAAADGDAAPAAADGGAVVDGADAEPDSKCAEDASDAPAAESPPGTSRLSHAVVVAASTACDCL